MYVCSRNEGHACEIKRNFITKMRKKGIEIIISLLTRKCKPLKEFLKELRINFKEFLN